MKTTNKHVCLPACHCSTLFFFVLCPAYSSVFFIFDYLRWTSFSCSNDSVVNLTSKIFSSFQSGLTVLHGDLLDNFRDWQKSRKTRQLIGNDFDAAYLMCDDCHKKYKKTTIVIYNSFTIIVLYKTLNA